MVKKNQGNRLEPLNLKPESNAVLNYDKRKLSHQLNPLPSTYVAAVDQRRVRSKIPVLQKKIFYPKQKKDDTYYDTSLSAADRRQKFQQSRLHAVGASNFNVNPVLKQQSATKYYCDLFPWYEGFILHNVISQPVPIVNQKNVLPPIKPLDVSVGTLQKVSQTKGLLGEFTHFPDLCNPVCSKIKKHHISTIPHLPPIMPVPPAPPPSISNSLEKDGNHISDKKRITSRQNFRNAVPTLF